MATVELVTATALARVAPMKTVGAGMAVATPSAPAGLA